MPVNHKLNTVYSLKSHAGQFCTHAISSFLRSLCFRPFFCACAFITMVGFKIIGARWQPCVFFSPRLHLLPDLSHHCVRLLSHKLQCTTTVHWPILSFERYHKLTKYSTSTTNSDIEHHHYQVLTAVDYYPK